jgi:hypothetical protein
MAIKSEYQVVYTVDTFSEILLGWGENCIVHVMGDDTWWNIINGQLVQQYRKTLNNYVVITTLADFPNPINGVITLVDNTTYEISGTVNIGTNTIVAGIRNTIVGIDRANDKLVYTGTGTLFTLDSTSIVKGSFAINEITLLVANGTLMNVISTAISFVQTTFSVKNMGTVFNAAAFAIRNSGLSNTITSGIVFSGTSNGTVRILDNIIGNNAGVLLNLSTAIFTNLLIANNIITVNNGQTFLSGTTASANISGKATLIGNIFAGVGTPSNIITGSDANWLFTSNQNIVNTPNNNAVATAFNIDTATPSNPTIGQTWVLHDVLPAGEFTGMLGITYPYQKDNYFLKVKTINGIKEAVLN